jgi:N-acetyl-alpha-D-muramate 1-phosphate uridylyltransferase
LSQTSPRAPHKAIVLAAGLGKRMLPITASMPKPLVKVAGQSLVDFALDRLHEAGIETVVVNVHHFADMLEAHLRTRALPRIIISDERGALLETGGGVKKALPLLGDEPFITFNSDSLWIEGKEPNLKRLVKAWDPERMDILMLVAPLSTSIGFEGRGDFHMEESGRLSRRGTERSRPMPSTTVPSRRNASTACAWRGNGCMLGSPRPSPRPKSALPPASDEVLWCRA